MNIREIRQQLTELEKLSQSPERWERTIELHNESLKTPEYLEYEKAVITEGVRRYGEGSRVTWASFSYEDSFCEGDTPEECIDAQIEAME